MTHKPGATLALDHLAVSGATLDEATAFVEEALGVATVPGGRHDVFHTHNRLLGLDDGLYLEAIAVDPAAATPDRPRWFDLDRFSGPARLTNWICRTTAIDAAVSVMLVAVGEPVALQRGDFRWRMAVPETGILPFDNLWPAIIQWDVADHPADRLPRSGVGLRRLTITHPEGEEMADLLSAFLADDRISIETGPVAMSAEFSTPHGPRQL